MWYLLSLSLNAALRHSLLVYELLYDGMCSLDQSLFNGLVYSIVTFNNFGASFDLSNLCSLTKTFSRLAELVDLAPKDSLSHLCHLLPTLMFWMMYEFKFTPLSVLLLFCNLVLNDEYVHTGSREIWSGYKGASRANWYFYIQYVAFIWYCLSYY